MFNEAFWFFYALDVLGSLRIILWSTAVIAAIVFCGATVAQLVCTAESEDTGGYRRAESWLPWANAWGRLRRFTAIVFAVCAPISIFAPGTEALLAGGGQYVAEEAELEDTLVRLRDLINMRLDEMLEEPTTTEE